MLQPLVSIHWLLLNYFIGQYLIGGTDYASGPYAVVIPAGQTSASFDLSINNDNIFEGNETFTLTLRTSSLPSRIMTLPLCHLDVTIVDNDCKLL